MKKILVTLALVMSFAFAIDAETRSQVQRVSISLQGADIKVVAASFAEIAGSDLEVDPLVVGTIDLKVHDVSWMTALDAACESVGCRWQLSGSDHPRVLRLLPREQVQNPSDLDTPISIDLEDAALADVLKSFGKIARHDVEIEPGFDGKITLGIQNVSVRTALRAVCESVGCAWEESGSTFFFRSVPDPPE